MLQINPFSPPAPFRPVAPAGRTEGSHTGPGRPFISAEDFDATGILAGVDPCESRYWWMPELHGCGMSGLQLGGVASRRDDGGRDEGWTAVARPAGQATSRGSSRRPTAAA